MTTLQNKFFLKAAGDLHISSDHVVGIGPGPQKGQTSLWTSATGAHPLNTIVEAPLADVRRLLESHGYDFIALDKS
jgi:hypothetical protein